MSTAAILQVVVTLEEVRIYAWAEGRAWQTSVQQTSGSSIRRPAEARRRSGSGIVAVRHSPAVSSSQQSFSRCIQNRFPTQDRRRSAPSVPEAAAALAPSTSLFAAAIPACCSHVSVDAVRPNWLHRAAHGSLTPVLSAKATEEHSSAILSPSINHSRKWVQKRRFKRLYCFYLPQHAARNAR